jgi:hypothetical protein
MPALHPTPQFAAVIPNAAYRPHRRRSDECHLGPIRAAGSGYYLLSAEGLLRDDTAIHGRSHVMAPRSRFLPDEVLGLFAAPPRHTAPPMRCHLRPTAPVDIGAACATCRADPPRPRHCLGVRPSLNISFSIISAVLPIVD